MGGVRGSCRQESAPRFQAEVWSQRPVRDTESLKPYGEHLKDLDADLVKVAPIIVISRCPVFSQLCVLLTVML